MRVIYWLITAPLLVFAVSFAVSNRDDVSLTLWPLPFEITLPVAAIGLIGMLLGALIGMFVTWANGNKARNRARTAERSADTSAREVANLNDALRRAKDDTTKIGASNTPKALGDS